MGALKQRFIDSPWSNDWMFDHRMARKSNRGESKKGGEVKTGAVKTGKENTATFPKPVKEARHE